MELTFEVIKDIFQTAGDIEFPKEMKYEIAEKTYQDYANSIMKLRFAVFDKMSTDWELASKIQAENKNNFVFFSNLFLCTYNPVFDNKPVTPFLIFPYQERFFHATQTQKRIMVIKPRTMGFTWLKAGINVWRLIYRSFKGIVVSRVEEDLDISGDRHQTIFGRMMFMIENLPFQVNFIKKHRLLIVGDNQYIGKTSSPNAARSTRGDLAEIEEAGFIADFINIMRAMNSVAPRCIIGGSVSSDTNGFQDYWENKDSEYFHIFWQYFLHPIYRCAGWIEKTRRDYASDEDGFKQEILVDFTATLKGTIFKYLSEATHIDSLPLITFPKKIVGIDPGFGSSPTSIWFAMYDTSLRRLYYIDYWEQRNTTVSEITATIKTKGFENAFCFIDEVARNTDSEGKSLLMRLNIAKLKMILANNRQITLSCKYTNDMLLEGRIHFLKNDNTSEGFSKLQKYQYAKTGDKQLKNEYSDCGDSFRYSHSCFEYFDNALNFVDAKRLGRNQKVERFV